ncbi:hypothetical protein [Flavobacterium sp. PL002]|uniref:hypothetical protein n=1 Tax=Flavobacterium sp. PL002 TaxID=1897058 RepID=UPI001787886E|nr:hypothetical protein [Flavobacterium sp. PL002]MBE0392676.1 hypothetical protein [Flavobacterium sp. PL002]
MKKIIYILCGLGFIILVAYGILVLGLMGVFTETKYFPASPPEIDYLHGVVVDENENPIPKLKIAIRCNESLYSITNSKGEFTIKSNSIKIVNGPIQSVLLIKKNQVTLDSAWTYTSKEFHHRIDSRYIFCKIKKDTIHLDTKTQKILWY